jgi:hypothetical protein
MSLNADAEVAPAQPKRRRLTKQGMFQSLLIIYKGLLDH